MWSNSPIQEDTISQTTLFNSFEYNKKMFKLNIWKIVCWFSYWRNVFKLNKFENTIAFLFKLSQLDDMEIYFVTRFLSVSAIFDILKTLIFPFNKHLLHNKWCELIILPGYYTLYSLVRYFLILKRRRWF